MKAKKDIDVVLKGCVRAEKIDDPAHYISTILERAKKENLQKIYQIEDWEDEEDFLKKLAEKSGKLLKVINFSVFFLFFYFLLISFIWR